MRSIIIAAAILFATAARADCLQFDHGLVTCSTTPILQNAQFTQPDPQRQLGPLVIGGPIGVAPMGVAAIPEQGGLLNVGQAFSDAIAPYINAAIQALLAAGLSWLAYVLKKKLNVNISEAQRAAIQTWLTNQASSLIADGAVTMKDGKVNVDPQKLEEHAAQYAAQIPDAAAFFGLTPEIIAQKIVDKIPQVPAGAQIVAQAHKPA